MRVGDTPCGRVRTMTLRPGPGFDPGPVGPGEEVRLRQVAGVEEVLLEIGDRVGTVEAVGPRDHTLLAVLELQRAGISLVKMVAAGIIISILVVSAWMALVAAAVLAPVMSIRRSWPHGGTADMLMRCNASRRMRAAPFAGIARPRASAARFACGARLSSPADA